MNNKKLDIIKNGEISLPIVCFNFPGDNCGSTFLNLRQVSKAVKEDMDKVFSETVSIMESIKDRTIRQPLTFFNSFLLWANGNFLGRILFAQNAERFINNGKMITSKRDLVSCFSNAKLSDILEITKNKSDALDEQIETLDEQIETKIAVYNRTKIALNRDLEDNNVGIILMIGSILLGINNTLMIVSFLFFIKIAFSF